MSGLNGPFLTHVDLDECEPPRLTEVPIPEVLGFTEEGDPLGDCEGGECEWETGTWFMCQRHQQLIRENR